MAYTSIQILPTTREKLSQMKATPRETYDEILNKLMELVPAGDDEGEFTDEFRVSLLNARLDLKRGKVVSHEAMKRSLGL